MLFYQNLLTQFFASPSSDMIDDKHKRKLNNLLQNDMMFMNIFSHYVNLYMYSYDIKVKTPWGSLSDKPVPGLNTRTMKYSFMTNACCIFRNGMTVDGHEVPGKYAMLGYPSGDFNYNLDPLRAWCIGYNGVGGDEIDLYVPGDEAAPATQYGYYDRVRKPKGFIVWANESRFPILYYMLYFSMAVADSFRTLDTTRFWLKRPVIFSSRKELVNSINRIIQDMEDNEKWTIESGSSMNEIGQATQLLNTNANGQSLKDVTALIQWYDAQMLELIGIDSNAQMDKKGENLTEAEVTVNDEVQAANINSSIKCMNKYFQMASEFEDFGGYEFHAVANTSQEQYQADSDKEEQPEDEEEGAGDSDE